MKIRPGLLQTVNSGSPLPPGEGKGEGCVGGGLARPLQARCPISPHPSLLPEGEGTARGARRRICKSPVRYYAAMLAVAVVFSAAASLRGDAPSAEDRLLAVLKSGAKVAEKANACRELKTCGTEKSIPALAALLADAELSHPARFALESMPYPAAGAALRDALVLGNAKGLARSGIIDSLGQRRDPLAVRLLDHDLASHDLVLVAAAATALGKIGTPEAAWLLDAVRADAQGGRAAQDRRRTAALRRSAPRSPASTARPGESTMSCRDPSEPRLVRAGAMRGRRQMPAAPEPRVITGSLAGDDAMFRAAAAAELHTLSDAVLGDIAGDMAKMPPTSQVAVLAAIRIRGHVALAPAVLAAAKSPHESVRLAAARALATVGDVTALPTLVELAAEEGQVGKEARQSLEVICGPKIDEQIFAPCGRRRTRSAGRRGSACSKSAGPPGPCPCWWRRPPDRTPWSQAAPWPPWRSSPRRRTSPRWWQSS